MPSTVSGDNNNSPLGPIAPAWVLSDPTATMPEAPEVDPEEATDIIRKRRLLAAIQLLPAILRQAFNSPVLRSQLSFAERSKLAMYQQMMPLVLPMLSDNLQAMSPTQLARLATFMQRTLSGAANVDFSDGAYSNLFLDEATDLCETLIHADSVTPEAAAESE